MLSMSYFTEIHPDALELAGLLEPSWPAASARLRASGVPLNEFTPVAPPAAPAAPPGGVDWGFPSAGGFEPEGPGGQPGYEDEADYAPDGGGWASEEMAAIHDHWAAQGAYEAIMDRHEMTDEDVTVANTAAASFAERVGDPRLALHPQFIELAYLAAKGISGGHAPSKRPRALSEMDGAEIAASIMEARTGHLTPRQKQGARFWGAA
jgi:hypothetical protein